MEAINIEYRHQIVKCASEMQQNFLIEYKLDYCSLKLDKQNLQRERIWKDIIIFYSLS